MKPKTISQTGERFANIKENFVEISLKNSV